MEGPLFHKLVQFGARLRLHVLDEAMPRVVKVLQAEANLGVLCRIVAGHNNLSRYATGSIARDFIESL